MPNENIVLQEVPDVGEELSPELVRAEEGIPDAICCSLSEWTSA